NLLSNAAKYTDRGGLVRLRAFEEDGEVVVSVADDGVGIDPEVLPQIFDLFVQERQAIDRSQGGLGLGLSIVKSFVRAHGGRVQAFSEGKGRGTEVVVRLPIVPAEVLPPRLRPRGVNDEGS